MAVRGRDAGKVLALHNLPVVGNDHMLPGEWYVTG